MADLLRHLATQIRPVAQILPHTQIGIRARRLGQVPEHPPEPQRLPERIDAVHEDAPGRRKTHPRQDLQERSLPRAVRPGKDGRFARCEGERHVLQKGLASPGERNVLNVEH